VLKLYAYPSPTVRVDHPSFSDELKKTVLLSFMLVSYIIQLSVIWHSIMISLVTLLMVSISQLPLANSFLVRASQTAVLVVFAMLFGRPVFPPSIVSPLVSPLIVTPLVFLLMVNICQCPLVNSLLVRASQVTTLVVFAVLCRRPVSPPHLVNLLVSRPLVILLVSLFVINLFPLVNSFLVRASLVIILIVFAVLCRRPVSPPHLVNLLVSRPLVILLVSLSVINLLISLPLVNLLPVSFVAPFMRLTSTPVIHNPLAVSSLVSLLVVILLVSLQIVSS
jgi:hypothetical protein